MIKLQNVHSKVLTRSLALEILTLQNAVWPSKEGIDKQYDRFLERNVTRPKREFIIAQDGDLLVASAEIFSRIIICENQTYKVGCLGSVCVLPQRQGEGFGKTVVQKVFSLIDANRFPVLLFQTGVPQFYLKLGAQTINNRFIDRQSVQPLDNPWWDSTVMIYPSDYGWPEGVIDLNGGAF